jgi:hypothetical protein
MTDEKKTFRFGIALRGKCSVWNQEKIHPTLSECHIMKGILNLPFIEGRYVPFFSFSAGVDDLH